MNSNTQNYINTIRDIAIANDMNLVERYEQMAEAAFELAYATLLEITTIQRDSDGWQEQVIALVTETLDALPTIDEDNEEGAHDESD